MHSIKTLKDLEAMRSSGLLPPDYVQLVSDHFHLLAECLGDGEPIEEFSLLMLGWLTVLWLGDDTGHIPNALLPRECGGLLGCWPEYVERFDLPSGTIYRPMFLHDNEAAHFVYVPAVICDTAALDWLEEYVEGEQPILPPSDGEVPI